MSNIKVFDTNNDRQDSDNILLENYMKNLINPDFYYELLSLKEKNKNKKQFPSNEEIIKIEYYYTTNKEKIENIARTTIITDRKVAQIELIKIEKQEKSFITNIKEYLITIKNIKDVFIFINKEDKRLLKSLSEIGFISLQTEEDKEYIPLLFEMERRYENGRHI